MRKIKIYFNAGVALRRVLCRPVLMYIQTSFHYKQIFFSSVSNRIIIVGKYRVCPGETHCLSEVNA